MASTRQQLDDVDQLEKEFHRDGFCILKQIIPKDILRDWAKSFAPLLETHLATQADPSFRGAHRFYVTLPFVQPFADPRVFEIDLVLDLVERIAGKDFVMCQLASDTPLLGSDYQDTHADTSPLFPETAIMTPSYQLALNFPLCDVDLENGPTEIARGTHSLAKNVALAKITSGETKLEAIPMELGDAMLRDVRGLHRGTPNRTAVPRPMIVIGYSRKWLFRPEVSIQIPRITWDALSDRAKHMLRFNPVIEEISQVPQQETYKAFSY